MGEEGKPVDFVTARRHICESCEHKEKIIGIDICGKCSCAIWGKTLMKYSSCPEGKWKSEE